MKVPIDRAGRIVIPKAMRDELGFSADITLEIEVVDRHLELSVPQRHANIVEGPNGPLIAATGTSISDRDVRRVLESTHERL